MMDKLFCYKTLPIWNASSLPQAFSEKNNTQVATWAKLHILHGELELDMLTEQDKVVEKLAYNANQQPPFMHPLQWPRIIKTSNDLRCQLSFFCSASDYTHKKYEMTKTHSEVVTLSDIAPAGNVLDLGCGSGRNSLYLQLLGFNVNAVDKSEPSIDNLNQIIKNEQLANIKASVHDINQADLQGSYDVIISTVVMMFLQAERIPHVIENMQSITKSGGYNLIVSAMSTKDYPCPLDFSFTFKEDELCRYYQDWDIVKYNENLGELHKTDLNGNRIKLKFATLLAKKR